MFGCMVLSGPRIGAPCSHRTGTPEPHDNCAGQHGGITEEGYNYVLLYICTVFWDMKSAPFLYTAGVIISIKYIIHQDRKILFHGKSVI